MNECTRPLRKKTLSVSTRRNKKRHPKWRATRFSILKLKWYIRLTLKIQKLINFSSCVHWTSLLTVAPHYLIENIQPLWVFFSDTIDRLTLSNVSIRHVLLCHRNLLTLDTRYGRCPEQYRLYQRLTSTDNASCSITTRSMITLLGLLVEPLCFLYQRESRSGVASAWSNTRKLPLLGTGLPDRGAQGIQTSYKERHPLLDLVDSETNSRL